MKWIQQISPAQMHEQFGMYQEGGWNAEMDRCWIDEDRQFCVTSRLIRTEWGKVEHVCIVKSGYIGDLWLSSGGERDIPWSVKMQIKNEIFGEKRLAIEVYPKKNRLVDVCDAYHLWVFEKAFELPFGIHPKDKHPARVKRGYIPFNLADAKTGEGSALYRMGADAFAAAERRKDL